MDLKNVYNNRKFKEILKNYYFHIFLLITFAMPIVLLVILDNLNIEGFYLFNVRFLFNETWKGRLFYLFFIWILIIESIIDLEKIIEKRPKNRLRILAFLACANVPLIYILAVNFWGMNTNIVELGRIIGIRQDNPYFLFLVWPLSFEYLVFFIYFLIAIISAYKTDGLRTFSISFSFLGAVTFVYLIDTYYPEGVFKPLQILALPTAACAAGVLELLGYNLTLSYRTGPAALPTIYITGFSSVGIVWSCAGVHSMLLYILIIALFFKRSIISGFRKIVYFVIGAVCTYFVNILRIVSYFVILVNSGRNAAQVFHDSLGELYFFFWMFAYILIMLSIERFRLIDKIRQGIQRMFYVLEVLNSRLSSLLRMKIKSKK